MSCTHPLKAFRIGTLTSGKAHNKITSYQVDHLERQGDKWIPRYDPFITPSCEGVIKDFTEIPCGKCIACRLAYSRQWADRCLLEMTEHKSNYFVTLTYDDDHVPVTKNNAFNSLTGEITEDFKPDVHRGVHSLAGQKNMTLVKKDLQLFMKRLRKRTGQKLRYYACGEYGDNTCRPHYHLIIFGLELTDLVPRLITDQGFNQYTSKTIENCWSNGFSLVMEACWETAAYTARYVMKKLNGNMEQFYLLNGIQKEFVLMSRRPGIARAYYDEHPELFDYQFINVSTKDGGKRFRIPKYFERMFEIDNVEAYTDLKETRKEFAEFTSQLKKQKSSQSYLAMLKDQEINLERRTKALERNEV